MLRTSSVHLATTVSNTTLPQLAASGSIAAWSRATIESLAYSLRDRRKFLKIPNQQFTIGKFSTVVLTFKHHRQELCRQGHRTKAAATVNVTYGSSWVATAELLNPTALKKKNNNLAIKRMSTPDASQDHKKPNPYSCHLNRRSHLLSLFSLHNCQIFHSLTLTLKMQSTYPPATTQCTFPHAQ
jgi:hypothetical protein